jgi:hypothetical protein
VLHDSYAQTDTATQKVLSVKYASPGEVPDIVLISAQEGVTNIAIPFEQALSANDGGVMNPPYYVATDAAKASSWLSATSKSGVPADLPQRVRGIGVTPSDPAAINVSNAFSSAFAAAYGSNPGTSGMGSSYDAVYSIAFAMAAAKGSPSQCSSDVVISGSDVAKGLINLGGPGNTYNSGGGANAQMALQELASGKTIVQQGTNSIMQWQSNGDIRGGTVEAWCIGKNGGAAWIFESSGERLDVSTQVISGSYMPCP